MAYACSSEKPLYGPEYRSRIIRDKVPQVSGMRTLKARSKQFCEEVVIILQTVNEDEKWAVLDRMKPPTNFELKGEPVNRPVDLDGPNDIVLGMFGEYASALIQTKMGRDCRQEVKRALNKLPNTKFVVAIGVAYAFDKEKCKYGDVLVSKIIKPVINTKVNKDGEKFFRESDNRTDNLLEQLHVFARGADIWNEQFKCTKDDGAYTENSGRYSKVHTGVIISTETLIDNERSRDELRKFSPEAIGGEMEGATLVEVQYDLSQDESNPRTIGITIIKGVADYADGQKDKTWQLTSAMGAASYAEYRLIATGGILVPAEASTQHQKQVDVRSLLDTTTPATPISHSACLSKPGLSTLLMKSPCRNDAFKLIESYSYKWNDLARSLDVPYNYRTELESKNISNSNRLDKVLNEWITEGEPVTWGRLIEGLKEIKLNIVVRSVKEFLKTEEAQKTYGSLPDWTKQDQ